MRTDRLIDELSQHHPKGFDLSLDRIKFLLKKLGNPQDRIPPVFHVAGTNGKGSTIAFLRAILEQAGYRVHVHTSPHLVNWYERYRLSGQFVSDDELAETVELVSAANAGKPITIFEIMSAVMFVLFERHEADFSLVEVGLGGRFDATNVIEKPLTCAIAPVALDHQGYLGDTLGEIAFEKAGIIKPGVPVAVGPQADEAREVIEKVAQEAGSPCLMAGQDFDFYEDATGFVFQDETGLIDLPMPNLEGEHQLANAALAIAAIRASSARVQEPAYSQGLKSVAWPGRLETLAPGHIAKRFPGYTRVLIDGGHNPAAGKAVASYLASSKGPPEARLLMICGMINTKDPVGYFEAFSSSKAMVFTVPVAMSEAGLPPELLAEHARAAGLNATSHDSIDAAVEAAIRQAVRERPQAVLFCGSLYMVGEVLDRNGTPPT